VLLQLPVLGRPAGLTAARPPARLDPRRRPRRSGSNRRDGAARSVTPEIAMTTPRQLRANRENSRLSTGPRTAAGLARAAGNALKGGLFSRLLVLEGLGESAAEFDAFRAAVVADLGAAGAVERGLADRAAELLWRLRRVARHEAAVMAAAAGDLPPHPDDVAPLAGNEVYLPIPPGAPAAYKLAHPRARLSGSAAALAVRRTAVEALAPGVPGKRPVDAAAAGRMLESAANELGWPAEPDP
jgi:hypothetical protein